MSPITRRIPYYESSFSTALDDVLLFGAYTAEVGDLALVAIATRTTLTEDQTITAPAGWTVVDSTVDFAGARSLLFAVYAKRMTAADIDDDAFPFTLGYAASGYGIFMLYTDAEVVAHESATGAGSAPAVAMPVNKCWAVALFGATSASDLGSQPNWTAHLPTAYARGSSGSGVAGNAPNVADLFDREFNYAGMSSVVTVETTFDIGAIVGTTVILAPVNAGWGVGQVRMGAS